MVSFFCILYVSSSCDDNTLILNRAILNKTKIQEGVIDIDTLETDTMRGVYYIKIIEHGALGHFSLTNAFIGSNSGQDFVYKVDSRYDMILILTKNNIYRVKFPESQWGWFYIKDGVMTDTLPYMTKIIDSLKLIEENNEMYITDFNGRIFFYVNGKVQRALDYGNLMTIYKNENFDTLSYSLYKLENDSLIVISHNGNDLFNQENGIFFVPNPGYGVIAKYDKQLIFNVVDSISKLPTPPSSMQFKSIQ